MFLAVTTTVPSASSAWILDEAPGVAAAPSVGAMVGSSGMTVGATVVVGVAVSGVPESWASVLAGHCSMPMTIRIANIHRSTRTCRSMRRPLSQTIDRRGSLSGS